MAAQTYTLTGNVHDMLGAADLSNVRGAVLPSQPVIADTSANEVRVGRVPLTFDASGNFTVSLIGTGPLVAGYFFELEYVDAAYRAKLQQFVSAPFPLTANSNLADVVGNSIVLVPVDTTVLQTVYNSRDISVAASVSSAASARAATAAAQLAKDISNIAVPDDTVHALLEDPTSRAWAQLQTTMSGQVADRTTMFAAAVASVSRYYVTPQQFDPLAGSSASYDSTAAVQSAINAALAQTDPGNVEEPTGQPAANGNVFFPLGTYSVGEITIPGSVSLWGVGGNIYAGSVLLQRTEGKSILRLRADTDTGKSQCTTVNDLTFKSVSGTSNSSVAQIITDTGIASNSVYIRRCWFKTPENLGVWITQGDDIRVEDCTFDVIPFRCIQLGVAGSTPATVSNAVVRGNTVYHAGLGFLVLGNVDGLLLTENRSYEGQDQYEFLTVTPTAPATLAGISVVANEVSGVRVFARLTTKASFASFVGNTIRGVTGALLAIQGGDTLFGLNWAANPAYAPSGFSLGAAFTGQACGLQNSRIEAQVVSSLSSLTPLLFDFSDPRVITNQLSGGMKTSVGFAAEHNLARPDLNGYPSKGSVVWDPPSLAVGASASTTATITGATFGQPVVVSCSGSLMGLTATAYVSSTDTVTVVLANQTGAPVDIGNSTFFVQLIS